MQRLLCINNKPIPGTHSEQWALDLIKEGQDYNGLLACAKNPNGEIVKGWHIPSVYKGTNVYHMARFIPLPDEPAELIEESIEEPEMVTV